MIDDFEVFNMDTYNKLIEQINYDSDYYNLIEVIKNDVGGRFSKVIKEQIICEENDVTSKFIFIIMYQDIIESKAIVLQKLHSKEKGKGKAKNALNKLKNISDKYKLPIYLVSYAFNTDSDIKGLDQENLDNLYQNMGFEFLYRPNKTQMAVYYPE